MLETFQMLRVGLKASAPKTLVAAAAHDEHTLGAVLTAQEQFPMRYILVGDRAKIHTIAQGLGRTVPEEHIVDGGDDADCARKAVALVKNGQADVLMKGLLETGTLLKAVLDKESGIRGGALMSHLAVLEVPGYHKLLSVTDGGMIPAPTLEQKRGIIQNTTTFYHRLGVPLPKIAALAASESVNPGIPDTVEAALLRELCEAGALGQCLVEGPLSFDIAVSRAAADLKGCRSQISGDVDVLLVPNITAGNLFCKGLLLWGGAKMAGCVLGARAPIVLVSRGASVEEKVLSIMLCLCAG